MPSPITRPRTPDARHRGGLPAVHPSHPDSGPFQPRSGLIAPSHRVIMALSSKVIGNRRIEGIHPVPSEGAEW